MADEKQHERLDEEGYTTFGGSSSRTPMSGAWFNPTGRLGKWFSKFFATKAVPYASQQTEVGDTPMAPLAGDTIVSKDVIKTGGPAGFAVGRQAVPILPEFEIGRKQRYKDYDHMDEYPEVGAAFDIYADDCTQKDTKGDRWLIKSDDELVRDEVKRCFETLKLDRFYWDIARNTVKYGDCFIEMIINMNEPKSGLRRVKILNPNFILRVENEYGYLTDFLQEIPERDNWEAFGGQSGEMKGGKYITLDRHQLVHFRMHTSDPGFYPYGKSVAALAVRIFRSLKLMEDAMLIYRLQRAPERRIFYVDIGNLPSNKAEAYVERLKEKFKKEKYYNHTTGSIDARYNPMSVDEDFFVPVKGNQGTKIDTLPGAQNLGDVDDVKYFRDKLLAALKIPKDYIVEKDQSPERKANLSQLDVKFARTVVRVQHSIEIGLENIAKRHLQLKGFPQRMVNSLRIELPDPSDMFTKRKLDVEEQKARVVGAVMGLQLFPKKHIYKEFYNLTDEEIEEIESLLEEEMEKMQEQMQDQMGMGMGMPGAMPPPGGGGMMPPEGGTLPEDAAEPGYSEAGGQESAENKPPTSIESTLHNLEALKSKLLTEEDADSERLITLNRVITKVKTASKKD